MPISAVSGQGVKELLWHVNSLLAELPEEPVEFEQEYFPDVYQDFSGPITVTRSEEEEGVFLVEGPRVERMLGYTNLESEKGFAFFQNFMKENGILEELENLGIEEGDTVKLYNLEFEYYR
jgi:GTP-binding protein